MTLGAARTRRPGAWAWGLAWAPRDAVTRFIPAGMVFPPITAALEDPS